MLGEPTRLEGRLVLGMALAALARFDEVLQEMRVAVGSAPQSAMAWLLRAEALVGVADLDQAQASLERARALDPSDPKLVQVEHALAEARAAGVIAGSVESTSTKEYPAKQVARAPEWGDEVSVTDTRSPMDAPPTKETVLPAVEPMLPQLESMRVALPREVEEHTTLDPDPFATVKGVNKADLHLDVPGPDDPDMRVPQRLPEEATMLGNPLGVGELRVDRATLEQEAIELPSVARSGGRGPSESTRNVDSLPPRDVPLRPAFLTEDTFSSFEETNRREKQAPAIATPRVTRRVEKLDEDDVPLPDEDVPDLASFTPSSDPSISLSSNEIVFVPDASVSDGSFQALEPLASADVQIEDDEPLPPPRPERRPRPASLFPDPLSDPQPVLRPELSFHGEDERISGTETKPPQKSTPAPLRARPRPAPAPDKKSILSRMLESLPFQAVGGRSPVVFVIALFAGAIAVAVMAGLAIRELRLRASVAKRYELAARKLGTGNFAGYQAAELLYKQILAERDDPRAAVLRAEVLSELAFEFGESTDAASRAVKALAPTAMPEEREARIYLALARGELDIAQSQAIAFLKDRPGPQARYLLGEAQLLLDQPEDAVAALHTAAEEDPQNPMVLHALGLAEAATRHPDRAFDAYARALAANPTHVATIIDRALLQLKEGIDRESAAGSLEGVVGKLVADAAPGQLARAYVGLAELELGKGNIAAARSALSSAAARRRDHPLLLEELAQAYADAFELESAEREAKRALQVSGRLRPRLILAEVALRRSRPMQALSVLEESGSSRPQALVVRALAKLELGRTGQARTDAELALQLDPASVTAAVALSRVDIAEQKYDVAQRRLDALEAQTKHAEVEWALGQVALAKRSPDKARSYFRAALVQQPLLLEARLALARLEHDSGQLPEAREDVNHILAINAAYVPARRELASISLDLGDPVAARDELDALIDKDADVDTLLGAARAHLLLGDARGAEDRADRALRLRPTGIDFESALAMKVRALLLDHRPSEAIQSLLYPVKTAIHGEIVALLIDSYIDLGRLDWADVGIDVAPIAARTGIELTLARARLAIYEGRFAAAKASIDEALGRLRLGRSPIWLRAQALLLEGQAELNLGQAKLAVKSLKASLELDPRNARAYDQQGLAFLDLKRYDEAEGAFASAIQNDPRLAEAQYYLGYTRRAVGDRRFEDALKAYIALEPRSALADDARRMLAGGTVTQTSDRPRSRRPGPRR